MARVALVCNLIRPELLQSGPLDAVAELDSEETLSAVESALRAAGHTVQRIEADVHLAAQLAATGVDIVFNIAERITGAPAGSSREALVPALCELLGLPYTGSGVLTTALCLDKPMTKRVLAADGIATPAFQLFTRSDEPLTGLRYPLIAKLACEGSSMGLSDASVVDDEPALRQQVQRLFALYGGPVLVEEFIEGREFTVGVLGNQQLEILPPAEVRFEHPRGINLFQPDAPVQAMALAAGVPLPPAGGGHESICPAPLEAGLEQRIRALAARAYRLLQCRDWCRMDMRLARSGELHLLELNPIAGIDPSYLLPRPAAAAGYSHAALVQRILDLALERAGLKALV